LSLLPVYPRLPLHLVSAKGTTLYTSDGRQILDFYGGHAVSPLGHGHPELAATIATSYATLDFYSNSLHMPVQDAAAEAVLGGSEHLRYAHFVNSGTEANESAMHLARRQTGRATIVTYETSFHGRTLASLTVTGLPFYRGLVPEALEVPEHWHRTIRYGNFDDLQKIDHTCAAMLAESVPSLGGVQMPVDGWYEALQARCREVGALFIMDEVQGGVGRLGTWFAHQKFGVQPDMVTLAKSVAGGYPVGIMLSTEAVGAKVTYGELGTTYGGGPVACAMVAKVAEIIHRDNLMERVGQIYARLAEKLARPGVEVRGAGCLIGVQTPITAKELRAALLEKDIILGVSGDPYTARLLLPYTVSDAEIDRFAAAFHEVFDG